MFRKKINQWLKFKSDLIYDHMYGWTYWSLDIDIIVVCFADQQCYQGHSLFSDIVNTLLFCPHTHGSIVVKTQSIISSHHKSWNRQKEKS